MLSANNSYFNSLFRMHVWILYRESVFGGVGWGWGEEGGNVLFCTVGRISWFLSSRLLKKGNMNFDHLFMKTGKSFVLLALTGSLKFVTIPPVGTAYQIRCSLGKIAYFSLKKVRISGSMQHTPTRIFVKQFHREELIRKVCD